MDRKSSKSFLEHLAHELENLPYPHQLAFAASCCERAYPNYLRFFQLARWGGSATLRTSLDRAWDFIEGATPALTDIEELERKCEAVTPDLDDFSSADIDVEAAAAQEAAFMVRLLLQFFRDKQPTHLGSVATFATDTVDMYIQVIESMDPADPQLDEKISRHPLMLQEIRKQESDAARLADVKTQVDMQEFRRYAAHPEQSNIGLRNPVG